jgi:hypothetical protein
MTLVKNKKERDHLEDLALNGMIILLLIKAVEPDILSGFI